MPIPCPGAVQRVYIVGAGSDPLPYGLALVQAQIKYAQIIARIAGEVQQWYDRERCDPPCEKSINVDVQDYKVKVRPPAFNPQIPVVVNIGATIVVTVTCSRRGQRVPRPRPGRKVRLNA